MFKKRFLKNPPKSFVSPHGLSRNHCKVLYKQDTSNLPKRTTNRQAQQCQILCQPVSHSLGKYAKYIERVDK